MNDRSKFFISPVELASRLGDKQLSVVDASWYLPAMERNGFEEFQATRIPGAVFFDIDRIADTSSNLPHMLPTAEEFSNAVGTLGISHSHEIIIYDGPGMFSVARAWWTFKVMGAEHVRILEGGFDNWKKTGLPVDDASANQPAPAKFDAKLSKDSVRNFDDMLANVRKAKSLVLDARPFARFTGEATEPRAGLASGHIPGSRSLAASDLVKDGRLLESDALGTKLNAIAANRANHITTSCGSGVTAAIISLALEVCGYDNHALYDGSWADWGSRKGAPIARWA